MNKKWLEELNHFKKTIKYLEKDYGRKTCRDILPSCPNCMAQFCIGWFREHLWMLENELSQEKNFKDLIKKIDRKSCNPST